MTAAPAKTVELLYFDGCPNHEAVLPRLHALLDRVGGTAVLQLRRVESEEEARRARFLGSPTVRLDGRDVEPDAVARDDYGLKCRLYRGTDGRIVGLPPDELVLARAWRGPPGLKHLRRATAHRAPRRLSGSVPRTAPAGPARVSGRQGSDQG